MPDLLIPDLEDDVISRLEQRAAKENISLNDLLLRILENAAKPMPRSPAPGIRRTQGG
jgi:hypothetical protein